LKRCEVVRVERQAGAKERSNVRREVTNVWGEESRGGRRGGAGLMHPEDEAATTNASKRQRG